MKILYVGSERSDAQTVAKALRGIDRAVTVSWVSRLEYAVRWLDENRDLAALVVEAQANAANWPSVVKHVRGPEFHPAVVAIVAEANGHSFEPLRPEPDDYIARNPSLLRDLPVVVSRAIARARERQQSPQASNAVGKTHQHREVTPEQPRDQGTGFAPSASGDQSQLEALFVLERAARSDLEQKLAHATAALQEAEQRHQAALSAVTEQQIERQAQYEIGMARATATWEMVDEQLRAAALEVGRARQDQASAAADVDRLSRKVSELTSQLADATATHGALEGRLAEAQTAVDDAHARSEDARLAAAGQSAERQREFEAQIAQEVDKRRSVEDLLAQAVSARDDAERRHVAAAADVERLSKSETELNSRLADVTASRNDLERRLAGTEAAFNDASTRATRERLAASKRAAEREAELDGQIRQERERCATLEQAVTDAHAALRDVELRHDAALSGAASDFAERQARVDRELSQTVADRDRLAQRLSTAESALDTVRHDHQASAADVERLTQREAALTSQLADVETARDTLDRQLADATHAIADADVALRQAHQRHDAALSTAAAALAEHRAESARTLSETVADRDHLAQRLSVAESALDTVRHDHQRAAADVERLTQREADLTSQLADVQAARNTLNVLLADAARVIADADERGALERAAAAKREEELEAAALHAEHSFRAEADALRARGLEQEAHFGVRFAQEQLVHESRLADMMECTRKLALERDALQQSLTMVQEQSQQRQEKLAATAKALEIATHRKEALQAEADQLPRLRAQLDEIRAEGNRLFEQAGVAMFRCTPDGALIQANRACTTLVGRRTLDQLPGVQFAPTVFEAPDVLLWLIERCLSTRAKESIETTWRRNDGGRLYVRLLARRLSPQDVIEVVAEDLTRLRVLQERLDRAHRMEAVGRFASEVAVTCGNLLSDIHQNGQQWLTTAGFNVDSRQQGELLIDEVRRAASLLRQLAAFGDEQARTPMLVDLNTLIRDLQPVLKRVAGDHVDVQLRDTSSPLSVDVQTERVERLLVNLASYGRERMPSGGRLQIDLGTTVVDRHFAAKHPNVRLGLHALITVTGIRTAARADGGLKARAEISQRSHGRVATRLGVDFGTLQGLVSECGGHLWMKVQPAGDMVAKIHLPLSSLHDQTRPRAVVTRGGRERPTTRWFQSTSS
jgi:hypothetical protein